ncbi:hypothetical protein [Achromobacter animicus]|uniref:hypothetical protein n=1 Tax=Achromobacter animicus TaxID=1389935 RepID=UPI002448955B|nr:hypothetical protein [Achromobacter animicus]MDH0686190.1 hypothetical protein [Achromobacter animicus]
MSLDRPPITGEFQKASTPTPPPQGDKPAPPFSLRLSTVERAELIRRAGSKPLGVYIRAQLLGNVTTPRRTRRQPGADQQALARLLAELGHSKLSSNLNQLAKAANTGALLVTMETEQALIEACEDVRRMRHALLTALGLRCEP